MCLGYPDNGPLLKAGPDWTLCMVCWGWSIAIGALVGVVACLGLLMGLFSVIFGSTESAFGLASTCPWVVEVPAAGTLLNFRVYEFASYAEVFAKKVNPRWNF